MDRQKLGKIGTFVLGGVAGAVAGILIAPRSGRELRGAMSSRAGEARERSREDYFEARERARERVAGMREPRPADEETREMPLGPLGEAEPEQAETSEAMPGEPGGYPSPEEPPWLRAVPPEKEPEDAAGEDPESLRRRIRQTRERLKRRGPGGGTDG